MAFGDNIAAHSVIDGAYENGAECLAEARAERGLLGTPDQALARGAMRRGLG